MFDLERVRLELDESWRRVDGEPTPGEDRDVEIDRAARGDRGHRAAQRVDAHEVSGLGDGDEARSRRRARRAVMTRLRVLVAGAVAIEAEVAGRLAHHAAEGGVAALDAVAEDSVVAHRVARGVLAGVGRAVAGVDGAGDAVVADRVVVMMGAALGRVAAIAGAEDAVVASAVVGLVDAAAGRAGVDGALYVVVAVGVGVTERPGRRRARDRRRDAARHRRRALR